VRYTEVGPQIRGGHWGWLAFSLLWTFIWAVAGVPVAAIVSLVVGVVPLVDPLVRHIRMRRYFGSEEFAAKKAEIASFVAEHNEMAHYAKEIEATGAFTLASATGQYAHLASFENTSNWNYRRDRNVADYSANVHNASLQVVRNASMDPIKYLIKYFNISADKDTLGGVQELGESISRLEGAVENLNKREAAIKASVQPPEFITKHYEDLFWSELGAQVSPITVPYPEYKFQYTSAGGNSGQATTVTLNIETIDALAATLDQKIKWAKSAAAQRSLMTAKLRNEIKARDGYTCQQCGIRLAEHPYLLLEVDHIVPVSRGGLSTPDNLQTLCWRDNRAKGAKLA
jgi:hypothetical protein